MKFSSLKVLHLLDLVAWNVDNYVESVDICPEYTVNIHVKLIMPPLSPCRIIGIFPAKSKKYAQKE